jgi:hypothetical protein
MRCPVKASWWDQFVVFWAAQWMTPEGLHEFIKSRGLRIDERLQLVRRAPH